MTDDLALIRAKHPNIPQDALPLDVDSTDLGGVRTP